MALSGIWKTLGIARTADRGDIRRAYARQLKLTNPEDDPSGFQALRAAYERALAQVGRPAAVDFSDNLVAEIETFHLAPAGVPAVAEASEKVRDGVPDALPEAPAEPSPAAPPAPSPHDIFRADLNRLEAIARKKDSAPEDLTDLFAKLVASPAMDDIGLRVATEQRLANLILHQAPRADALIRPAMEFFGWEKAARRITTPWFVAPILGRNRDQGALKTLKTPDNDHARAWRELTAPPRPFGWRRRLFAPVAGDVRNLLTYIRQHHPTIEGDLDKGTVAAWDRYFNRPHLDAWTLWNLILALPCLMLCSWLVWGASPELLPLALFPAAVPVLAAGLLVRHFGYTWPRHLWRQRARFTAPPILRYGWAGTGLAALILAAAPPSWFVTAGAGLLALATLLWAGTITESDGREAWDIRMVLNQLLLILWWGVGLWRFAPETGIAMSLALAACILATGVTKITLFRLWTNVPKALGLAIIALLFLSCIGGMGIMVATLQDPDLAIWAFTAVAAVILIYRAPLLPTVPAGWGFLWRFGWLGVIAFSHGADALNIPWFFLGGVAMVGWTFLNLIGRFIAAIKA